MSHSNFRKNQDCSSPLHYRAPRVKPPWMNLSVFEKNFSLVDVYSAQEAFITGTLGSLTQVLTIDGRAIGNSNEAWPITEKLRSLYKALTNV